MTKSNALNPLAKLQPRRKLCVAVMSQNAKCYSTKRLVAALKARGHKVRVIDTLRCTLHMKHGQPTIYYKDELLQNFDVVIPRIRASITFYGLTVLRQFELMGVPVLNSSRSILRTRDKLRSHQLFATQNIRTPDTWFASTVKELPTVLEQLGDGPYVAKILEGTHGKGVLLLDDATKASATIEALMGLNADLLVQEFIEEAGGADLRVIVIGGKIVAAMLRQAKDGEFRANLHRGGSAHQADLTLQERITALRAAKTMGLEVAGVDMIRSEGGPMVLEVNSSPGLKGIEQATGADVAGAMVDRAESLANAFRPTNMIRRWLRKNHIV